MSLDTPWLQVSTFWPLERDAQLGPGYASSITWDQSLVEVQGGMATLSLGEDPVWITPSSQGSADAGPLDTGGAPESVALIARSLWK